MEYKEYKRPSYNIYTIKTDHFKSAHMEIVFRTKAIKEKMTSYAFLIDMLCENTKKYPSRRSFITKLEEIYKTSIYGTTVKLGNILHTDFIVDFINPKYITDSNYLEEVFKLSFEVINEPNVTNKEFDLKTFNNIKERIKRDIESVKENSFKESIREAINASGIDTPTAYPLLGTLEDLDNITPSNLYDSYEELFKDNVCDIFIIGNLDMDLVATYINKYFIKRHITSLDIPRIVDNKKRNKPITKEKESSNTQSSLVMIYNVDELTEKDRNITFQVFNYIFGNGGLTCKLYQNLREKNSLCYGVGSYFLRHDNILLIQVSLDNINIKKAINLINKSLKEMQSGLFSEEELEDAIKNLLISLDYINDNNVAIISDYTFRTLYNFPQIDERKELYKNVSKEDIINVSKKIKINTIFTLKGVSK